jgi:hypothetical protein
MAHIVNSHAMAGARGPELRRTLRNSSRRINPTKTVRGVSQTVETHLELIEASVETVSLRWCFRPRTSVSAEPAKPEQPTPESNLQLMPSPVDTGEHTHPHPGKVSKREKEREKHTWVAVEHTASTGRKGEVNTTAVGKRSSKFHTAGYKTSSKCHIAGHKKSSRCRTAGYKRSSRCHTAGNQSSSKCHTTKRFKVPHGATKELEVPHEPTHTGLTSG